MIAPVLLAYVTARLFGLLVALPLEATLRTLPRLFVALCFALPFVEGVQLQGEFSFIRLALEFFIGFLVGTPIRFLVESSEMLGELVDTGRGQTIGSVMDPLNGEQGSEFAKVFKMGALVLSVQAGGLDMVISTIGATFAPLPVNTNPLATQIPGDILRAGFTLIGAVVTLSGVWFAGFMVIDTFTAVLAKTSQGFSFSSAAPWLKMVASIILISNLISYPREVEEIVGSVIDTSVYVVKAFNGDHD